MQDDLNKYQQWANIFNNPQEVAELVATNVLNNYKTITNDVDEVVHDWHSAEYLDLGTALAKILLDATGTNSNFKKDFESEDAVDVVAGILDGII